MAAIKLVGSPGGKLSGDPRAERSLRGFSDGWAVIGSGFAVLLG